jgi:hypothetical protein
LAENAARVGLDFERLPLVVQFNKRDLPDILAEGTILDRWNAAQWPLVFACALTGNGVLATFEALLCAVFARYDADFKLSAEHGLSVAAFSARAIGSPGESGVNP